MSNPLEVLKSLRREIELFFGIEMQDAGSTHGTSWFAEFTKGQINYRIFVAYSDDFVVHVACDPATCIPAFPLFEVGMFCRRIRHEDLSGGIPALFFHGIDDKVLLVCTKSSDNQFSWAPKAQEPTVPEATKLGPGLSLVVIRVRDLDRSLEFFKQFGLSFIRHRHGSGPEHLAAELGDAVFEIYPQTPESPSTLGTRIGFKVVDLDTALATLQEIPGCILSPAKDSPWGRRAVVCDPDGHRIELTQA